MAAMNMVSAGGFSGVSFHLRRCPQGVLTGHRVRLRLSPCMYTAETKHVNIPRTGRDTMRKHSFRKLMYTSGTTS